MDKIDKYIQKVVNKEITEPKGFENAIRTALYSEKFNKIVKKRKLIKSITIFCILTCIIGCLLLISFLLFRKYI